MALRAGGEAVLIDSPYLPDELDALPGLLAGAGFEPDGLLDPRRLRPSARTARLPRPDARHGRAVGGAPAARAGAAQRELRDYDAEFYVERPAPLALGAVQGLPCPAGSTSGVARAIELELHPAEGHAGRHGAVRAFAGRARDRRLPVRRRDPLDLRGARSRTTARRWPLGALVGAAEMVVPGHGPHHGRTRRCGCSTRTWTTSTRSSAATSACALPQGRSTKAQREIHAENLTRVG